MKIFITNSNKKVYPSTREGDYSKVYVAKGEKFNYQVSVYNDSFNYYDLNISINSKNNCIIRREDLVPLKGHSTLVQIEEIDHPGEYWVPDVLVPSDNIKVPPYSTMSFWITVEAIHSGDFKDTINIEGVEICQPGENQLKDSIEIEYYVADFEITKKKNIPCLHWFYSDAISDFYKLPLWSDEFWAMFKKWVMDYSNHGNTYIYLPLFTPSLDGIKKPTQLVNVSILDETVPAEERKYCFDFTNAKKYISIAKECGINNFEIVHLFTQWGVEHPIRIYKNTEFNLCPTNVKLYEKDIEIDSEEDKNNLVIDITKEATSLEYKNFLKQFFVAFKAFTEENGIYDNLIFHVSDEPSLEHLENYKKAFYMLKELKPDIKLMDALSDREIADAVLSLDPNGFFLPIPAIYKETFNDIYHGAYFCCGPREDYINRFLDTPLYKTRMLGALMYKKNASFFLHWGYNYYYISKQRVLIDPYCENTGCNYPDFPPGDPFIVYPGEDGPLNSIRYENFYDTLQDFDLLTNLQIDKNSELLKDLKTYNDFPRDVDFIWNLRKKLLEGK